MSKQMNWVAFFSQTGSEIVNICERINKWPNLIVSNRQDGFEKINPKLISGKTRVLFVEKKPTVQRYHEVIRDDSIVTLHGWLRIMPEEVCDAYEIYNGHPGDIVAHPELKGKDPQQKAIDLGHREAGCVLHKVTATLDDGPIVATSAKVIIQDRHEPEVFTALHDASVDMWVNFLKGKFDERS